MTVIRFSQVVESPGPPVRQRRDPVAQLGSMPEYSFLTTWCLEAPRERVWDAIWEAERWPQWWRGVVASEVLSEGDEIGIGQVGRYTWRSRLPYALDFEMTTTRVERPHLLEGEAKGELAGVGRWRLFEEDGVG